MTVVNMAFIGGDKKNEGAELSLSLQTTAKELVGLMRHSLELVHGQSPSRQNKEDAPASKTP